MIPGEQRRLLKGNIFRLLREIEFRRLFDAVDPPGALLPEVNLVQVHLKDLFFRVPQLKKEREFRLAQFAPEGLLWGKEEVLRELLRDGGAALSEPLLLEVGKQCPADREDVDPDMGIKASVFRRDHRILEERRNGGKGNRAPGLHLRTHDAADLLRFQADRVQLHPGRGDQRHDPPVANQDVHRAALAGGLFGSVVAEENPDLRLLFGVRPGCGRLSRDFPVGESLQSLGEAEVPEVVPLTDLRGAAVEDGGDFPVRPRQPPDLPCSTGSRCGAAGPLRGPGGDIFGS